MLHNSIEPTRKHHNAHTFYSGECDEHCLFFTFSYQFFGLGEKSWLSNMISAGERFCGEDWSKLRVKDPSLEEEDLLRYCFSSAYIVSLLHDTLGVPLDDERYIQEL